MLVVSDSAKNTDTIPFTPESENKIRFVICGKPKSVLKVTRILSTLPVYAQVRENGCSETSGTFGTMVFWEKIAERKIDYIVSPITMYGNYTTCFLTWRGQYVPSG
jgi:hypothetical protein